jgi:hypothetical protein
MIFERNVFWSIHPGSSLSYHLVLNLGLAKTSFKLRRPWTQEATLRKIIEDSPSFKRFSGIRTRSMGILLEAFFIISVENKNLSFWNCVHRITGNTDELNTLHFVGHFISMHTCISYKINVLTQWQLIIKFIKFH